MIHKADFLIITVTEVESRAVIKVFREATGQDLKPEPIGDRIYLDLGEVNGGRVFMGLSGIGTGGVYGSQEGVRKGIEALSPSAVIMVGIAFGINEHKQAIGDVLVSERLMLYVLQRVSTDKEGNLKIIPRSDRPHGSPWLINRLQVANLSWDESMAKIRFGLILSGDKLVDNIDFRGQLLKFEPEAIGGEMEGAGLYVACQNSKVDWILIKAICDWADGQKTKDKDARQQLAAHNAAAFVLHALQQAPLKRDRETYPQMERLPATPIMSKPHKPVHSSIPPQAYFFGREKEMGIIAEAISPEARTWGVLIDGPGGIGKTALAIRAGHLASASQFERKIFLSAKVRELTPTGEQNLEDFMLPNYMVMLTELARELGLEKIAQTDPNKRANAVRRALADVRVLIIIDNVETFPESERVRLYQFLSRLPEKCKAIVTSRRRVDIDARVVRLDRLERKDALDLMAELAKNNSYLQKATEPERGDLYEITNGNPLLIRWTAGQIGREGSQCRTIPEVCAFLKSAPKGNDPLEYIFGDLLDTFTESETNVLAALAHFTRPAKEKWIADIAGIAEQAAFTALEDLTDRALLESDEGVKTFLLLPLAATFLRRKCPEVIATTGSCLIDRVYVLALENGYDNFENFTTLEVEWQAIAAALPLFMQFEDTRLQRIYEALETFLNFSGRWDELLALNLKVEEKALTSEDLSNAGWSAYQSGMIYYKLGRAPELLACADRCSVYWEKGSLAGAWERTFAIRLRGLGHELEENFPAAIEVFQERVNLGQVIEPESERVAVALNDLAGVERSQGNFADAERDFNEALRIARKVNARGSIPLYLCNLTELALDREDWAAAEAMAREAIDLAEKVGRQEIIGASCMYLAKSLARQSKPQEGLPYARRAAEIFTQLLLPTDMEEAQAILKECDV